MRWRAWRAIVPLVLVLSCAGRLCGDDALAELETHRGEVQRDRAEQTGMWGEVARGDRFRMGDGLRTGRDGSARLVLAADGVAQVEANTLLRFVERDPRTGGRRVTLEQGAVRLTSGEGPVDVSAGDTRAHVAEGASVRIVARERELSFDVLVGKVSIDAPDGEQSLIAGQTLALPRTRADADDARDAARAPEPAGDASLPDAAADALGPTVRSDEPVPSGDDVDLTLVDLASVTIHTPSLPVTVRTPSFTCASAAKVSLDGDPVPLASEARGATLRITRPGAHRLKVGCGRSTLAQLTLQVLRDAAHGELPRTAQAVEIDADGRRYTVRYQNLLPHVTVRFRDARPASGYTLFVRRNARTRSFASARPERTLPASEISEGSAELWFTSDNGQRSKTSVLRTEFDNTAEALALAEPREGASASGDTSQVLGVALLRSHVWANGAPLAIDDKGRFKAQVALSNSKRVVVRASHPAAGVHYYLRRLR